MGISFLRAASLTGLISLVAGALAQAQDPGRPAVGGIGSPVDAMIFPCRPRP